MSKADYFEVQRLVTEGDRAGQWETWTNGDSQRSGDYLGPEKANQLRAAYQQRDPSTAFRVVPFGTGPQAFDQDCPGHVAHPLNAQLCGRCGVNIAEFRPEPPGDVTAGGGC